MRRDSIVWGKRNPFSDPRLHNLDEAVKLLRRGMDLSRRGVQSGGIYGDLSGDLPKRPRGYYREYSISSPAQRDRGKLRIILGQQGEVYVSGDHYEKLREILEFPT
jgi:ribonuclease T1